MYLQDKKTYVLDDVKKPNFFRDQFPYSEVPRIIFDNTHVAQNLPENIWITDTTFRDGQQSRAPYTPRQIAHLYGLMGKLGGKKGIIRQSEFFLYSKRDRRAVEKCKELNIPFPEITGWIRANAQDLQLVKDFEIKETGLLTSVSDYHIFLKLKSTRKKIMEKYLSVVKEALSLGIVPRCHFEDVTRADIYGFCVPFAQELLKLSQESGIPVKIRLCDTMGYGITYPGAVLPRSVDKLAHAFVVDAGYPSEYLEWHGHNDFHKVHINGTTGWLYGISSLNASLLGYGERTGNPPLEGAIMEYIGLKGTTDGIDTTVITEIAEYFRKEIKADIPINYPFVGTDFNTTRAGIHADGLLKNEEIYNIFDTDKLLNRPLRVMVTDKSGMAGIAHWLNENVEAITSGSQKPLTKRDPRVGQIYDWVMAQYNQGRTTSISAEEILVQARHYIPGLFESSFDMAKVYAHKWATKLADKIFTDGFRGTISEDTGKVLSKTVKSEPAVQFITLIDLAGNIINSYETRRGDKARFRNLKHKSFADREWFKQVVETEKPYHSELFVSKFTDELTITIALPISDAQGKLGAVLDIDFNFNELSKLMSSVAEEVIESDFEN